MKSKILIVLLILNFFLIIINWLGGPENDWLIYIQGIITIPIIIIPFTDKQEKKEE